MIKNKKIRNWYKKMCPIKYTESFIREIRSEYDEFLKRKPNETEIYQEKSDRDYNIAITLDDLEAHFSDKIISKTKRYGIPLPSTEPKPETDDAVDSEWSQSIYGFYYLNEKSRYELKKKIDEERKIKRETFTQYVSLIIGFMGMLVAIISML